MKAAYTVDVAIVGGSTAAVSAAVAAAGEGAGVFLAAQRPHLGEDICDTLRLELAEGEEADTELGRAIFGRERWASALHVKKVLDRAMAEAGVHFLFGCYATEVLRDDTGAVCGFVMANRGGLQAVRAGTVIDATDRAWFAAMAGARAAPWPGGEQAFERTLVLERDGQRPRFVTHEVRVEMPGRGFLNFNRAEQEARDATWTEGQLQAAERLFQVPPDPIICERSPDEWSGELEIGHFRPAGVERLYVLGGRAGVPRNVADGWLRPAGMLAVGEIVGRAAAREAAGLDSTGRACESAAPPGPPEAMRRYDVLVVGGGTSGAAAAIAAARRGARVLVAEYQRGLGGTGTLGMIGKPYHGACTGFSAEVPFPDAEHNLEHKMEWYRRQIREAGGDVWFGVLACGAHVEGDRVRGAIVATPEGRKLVLADVVIDATGNADVAAAAGAETLYGATEDGDIAMQGAGLPARPLGKNNVNTDYLLVDEADPVDVCRALVGARRAMDEGPFDVAPMLQTRERRRIVGDHVLDYLDQIGGRTYPDSVVLSRSDYDSHGYPNLPYFALFPHTASTLKANHPAPGGTCYTPYRCLLPRGLAGILVTGLGISMRRDATALVRMQFDLANQGYAAGVAAAMAAGQGVTPREIDVHALQEHLVEVGNLPEEALTHEDSFPLPEESVAEAVRELGGDDRERACRALAEVLSHAEVARPYLRAGHEGATGADRLLYARVLGFMGETAVVPQLSDALREAGWDEKVLQGTMAEYAHLPTPTDSLVLALGWTRDPAALPVILEKVRELDAGSTLSHHRAVALALEAIADPPAAPALAQLLRKPGMSGHVMRELEPLPDKPMHERHREGALREIVLARALYRCGDCEGLGEAILRGYCTDLRSLFRRHAAAVLEG